MADLSAPVFDLQTLSTHDGPGFRTVVFLQGCSLRCAWCCNPEGQEPRPYLRWRSHLCQGCLRCVAACPSGAATVATPGVEAAVASPASPVTPAVVETAAVAVKAFAHREPVPGWPCPAGSARREVGDNGLGGGDIAPRPLFDRTICRSCRTFECLEACCEGALEQTGRPRTAADVLAVLRRDVRLYRNSGGGVTFSGGEPLAHAAFVLAVVEPLRSLGMSVALETCGAWQWSSPQVQAVLRACDCIFFDVKTLDPERHLRFTGYPLAEILANLERLVAMPGTRERIVLSLPLIPGVSDDPAHATAVADLADRLGLRRVRLLPYHRLALGKYEALGLDYPHASWDASLQDGVVERIREILVARGLEVGG